MRDVFVTWLKKLNRNKIGITSVLLAIVLGTYVLVSFVYPYIGSDAGFYLKIAFDLANGISFYNDMNVAYNPLGMYILSAIFYVFPDAGFYTFNSFYIVLYIVNAFLFYRLLEYSSMEKKLKRLLILILLVSFYLLHGSNFYLEPLVLFFQLIALLLLFSWEKSKSGYLLLVAGLNCFLAFYSKQYGLFMFPAFFYFILNSQASLVRRTQHLAYFLMGFLIPLSLTGWYVCTTAAVSAMEFMYKILGISYLSGEEVVTGINYHFPKFLESLMNFVLKLPILVVLFYALIRKEIHLRSKWSVFYLILAAGSCIQLFFAAYSHYYQLIFPYLLLLIVSLYEEQDQPNKVKLCHVLSIASIFIVVNSLYWFTNDFNRRKWHSAEQAANKNILHSILPEREKVYLQGILPSYYFICKFDSPNYKDLGYRFSEELSPYRINRHLPAGSYLILRPEDLEHEPFNKGYSIIRKIELHGGKECILVYKDIQSLVP